MALPHNFVGLCLVAQKKNTKSQDNVIRVIRVGVWRERESLHAHDQSLNRLDDSGVMGNPVITIMAMVVRQPNACVSRLIKLG